MSLLAGSIATLALLSVSAANEVCTGFGPQAPRDIRNPAGENRVVFSIAPAPQKMNLCDIHFHKQAENTAAGFSIPAGSGPYGGFRCNATRDLTLRELQPLFVNHCTNVAVGDTIEVHWVYTSCDVKPAPGLGSCLSEATCPNPNLRVEAQVFLLVNDYTANRFANYDSIGKVDGYYQARSLPSGTGDPVVFLGSTTGASYSDEVCSPLQVSWSVRPACAKLDMGSLSTWCRDNVFKESAGRTVRQLVRNPNLLSTIKSR